jgi:hypothetical protein
VRRVYGEPGKSACGLIFRVIVVQGLRVKTAHGHHLTEGGILMLKVGEQGLFGADLTKGLNFFAGAGFSTLARNEFGEALPVGGKLKDLLIKEFDL